MLQFIWQGQTYNLETLSKDDYDTLNKAIQSPSTKQELIESLKKMIEDYCPTMPSGYTSLHKAIFKLLTLGGTYSLYPNMSSTAYQSDLAPNGLWKSIVELSVDEIDGKRLAVAYQNKGVEGLRDFIFNEQSLGMLYLYFFAINTSIIKEKQSLVELIQEDKVPNSLEYLYVWRGRRELTFVNTSFINAIARDNGILSIVDKGSAKQIAENILWPILLKHIPQLTTQRLSEDFKKVNENDFFNEKVVDLFTEKMVNQSTEYTLALDNLNSTLSVLVKKLGTRLTTLYPNLEKERKLWDDHANQPYTLLGLMRNEMDKVITTTETLQQLNELRAVSDVYKKAYFILNKIKQQAFDGSEKPSDLIPILNQMNELFRNPVNYLEPFKTFAKKTIDSPSTGLQVLGALMLGLAIAMIPLLGVPIGVISATVLAVTGFGVFGYGRGRQNKEYSELLTDLTDSSFEQCQNSSLQLNA
jgi:hypothetical protein